MAYIDQGRSWAYTTIREHRGPTAIIGLALFLAIVASLLPRGAADAATSGAPASLMPSTGIYFGTYSKPRGSESRQDAILRVEAAVGRRFAIDHQFYTWNDAIPSSYDAWTASQGRIPFMNWKMPAPWTSVTNGSQDAWIQQRAEAFKAFGAPVYLAIHHEPENDTGQNGTKAEYVAAYRHVVDVFRARGVTNVGFAWTMMAWSFDSRSGESINDWYPGDNYVDFVGADGYNWNPGRAGSNWTSFQTIYEDVNSFAVSHGKRWLAVEYGVQEDPSDPGHKAAWFSDLLATAQGWPALMGLIYFDSTKAYVWDTDSSATSMAGYAALGRSPLLNPGIPQTPAPAPSPTQAPSPKPSTTPAPNPSPSPSQAPQPNPSPSPSPSPTPTPSPSPSTSPTPMPLPGPSLQLANTLNGGSAGSLLSTGWTQGPGSGFDVVINSGGTVTLDSTHTRGIGLSAKHTVGVRGNAYYGWGPTFAWAPTWYGRTYVWFDALPSGDVRLVRAQGSGTLRFAIDVLRNGRLRLKDGGNVTIATTRSAILTSGWVRVEWGVDQRSGSVQVRLFNSPNLTTATETLIAASALASGSTNEVEIGRSGTQNFSAVFWTDDPAISTQGYVGPVL